jgi:hypothetical protein
VEVRDRGKILVTLYFEDHNTRLSFCFGILQCYVSGPWSNRARPLLCCTCHVEESLATPTVNHPIFAGMAGPRTNLAVTKDGGTYNKLQRPNNLFDGLTASKANERKRERAAVDVPTPVSSLGNKRAKKQHSGSTAAALSVSNDGPQYRNGAPVGECGMRMTFPIDEEDAQDSDDSLGEALAYLRSVR